MKGADIRAIRGKRKARDFAAAIRVSTASLWRYEHDLRTPPSFIAKRIRESHTPKRAPESIYTGGKYVPVVCYFPEPLLKRVGQYWHDQQLRSRMEAIRELVAKGLTR